MPCLHVNCLWKTEPRALSPSTCDCVESYEKTLTHTHTHVKTKKQDVQPFKVTVRASSVTSNKISTWLQQRQPWLISLRSRADVKNHIITRVHLASPVWKHAVSPSGVAHKHEPDHQFTSVIPPGHSMVTSISYVSVFNMNNYWINKGYLWVRWILARDPCLLYYLSALWLCMY